MGDESTGLPVSVEEVGITPKSLSRLAHLRASNSRLPYSHAFTGLHGLASVNLHPDPSGLNPVKHGRLEMSRWNEAAMPAHVGRFWGRVDCM